MCVCVSVSVCVCKCVCVCVCVCMYIYVQMFSCTHKCIYECIPLDIYFTCVRIYVHTHAYVYICIQHQALCHDIDHPGVTNEHLINSGSTLALLYNDRAGTQITSQIQWSLEWIHRGTDVQECAHVQCSKATTHSPCLISSACPNTTSCPTSRYVCVLYLYM